MPETPRGIKNNNPGNIIISPIPWRGKDVPSRDTHFESFADPEDGIRALAKNVLAHWRGGQKTIAQLITAWAPPNENNTAKYIAAVAALVGVNEHIALNLENDISLTLFAKAVIIEENGQQPYPPELLSAAINDALGHVPALMGIAHG